MRSKEYGMIRGVSGECSREETLGMFRKMCASRSFELKLKEVFDAKRMRPTLLYTSVGQESISSAIATVFKELDDVFPQHRCHDIYLAFGGDPVKLIDELLGLPTGCAGGMGGSASLHKPEGRPVIHGHDGLMGTQVPIAAGFSFASGHAALACMGDASAEEDYVIATFGLASAKNIKTLFVCADNGLSILTPVSTRRNSKWNMKDVAAAFGLPSVEITDDPWLIMHYIKELQQMLPAFMNIHTVRNLWHNGTGSDGPPEWDRFALVKDELARLGLAQSAKDIEEEERDRMNRLWEERLALNPYMPPEQKPARQKSFRPTVAETIRAITRYHLEHKGGFAAGQCLTAVGWVGGTVPEMTEKEGLVELTMADVAGRGFTVGIALAGRRPIDIVRYQGFECFNSIFINNYAAKSKDMWNIPCPILVRSIGMDGGVGPVASGSHHSLFTRTPGVAVYAPMTPKEYEYAYEWFMAHDIPMYLSEHRSSFQIDYEMDDVVREGASITLFPISSTRLSAIEAATLLEQQGIVCNIIHVKWLKPFEVSETMKAVLAHSRFGGVVIDGDFENGHAKCIAHDLMLETGKNVHVLGFDERTAGFAPQCDNLPPTADRISAKVTELIFL